MSTLLPQTVQNLNGLNMKNLDLVESLDFREKVERSLDLIKSAYNTYGDGLVVANSLGKDSMAVWHLAKTVSPSIKGFIVTTRFKPPETIKFMYRMVAKYPELKIYSSVKKLPVDGLYSIDPNKCCDLLKVEPTRNALIDFKATCWVTGLRCTEGQIRSDYQELEYRDPKLVKLNPILLWYEREVWQYLATNKVDVNPLYAKGYRSLGCGPCTAVSTLPDERAGRWRGMSKCGGECGIHTRPLLG